MINKGNHSDCSSRHNEREEKTEIYDKSSGSSNTDITIRDSQEIKRWELGLMRHRIEIQKKNRREG